MLQVHKHLTEKHDISLNFTEEIFYCDDDFRQWKMKIEKESQSSFVVQNYAEKNSEVKLSYYVCHRSGFPNAKKDRVRQMKKSDSVKSGCTCPARIKVITETVDEVSCIKVQYQSVHVGHDLDVTKLRLSKEEKARLASSLNAGLPMSSVLNQTRENYSPSKRYCRTTMKDLHNICRTFKIKRKVYLHPDDAASVDIIVKKMQSTVDNPVLVYKPVGEILPEYPTISKDDFLLGIMNDVQEKILEMYGSTCIMIDSTYGANQYSFHLTAILVRDENHESLPVAVFFSSRTAARMLHPFFGEIKKRLPQLKTKVVMSDDMDSFYDAWQTTFKDGATHLLCSWYVNNHWSRNLNAKVRNAENKEAIKRDLKNILNEVDIITFQNMMKSFIKKYEAAENDFISYFQTHFEGRASKWAYCYRIERGINANMRLERWHRQLKCEEDGAIMKRLDKTLSLVANAVAKKLLSTTITMEIEKLSSRIILCQQSHKNGLDMKDDYGIIEVGENKCIISKKKGTSTFTYEINNLREACGCVIKCEACNVCIHSISCTCVDYCIRFVICKHIHYVCQKFKTPSSADFDGDSEDSLTIYDNEPLQEFEREVTVSAIPKSFSQNIVEDEKHRVVEELQKLQSRILGINSMAVIENVKDCIKSINSYLDASVPDCSRFNVGPKIRGKAKARPKKHTARKCITKKNKF